MKRYNLDGLYVVYPEGAELWELEVVTKGIHITGTNEVNAASHHAARDKWSDVIAGIDFENLAHIDNAEEQEQVAAILGIDPETHTICRVPERD